MFSGGYRDYVAQSKHGSMTFVIRPSESTFDAFVRELKAHPQDAERLLGGSVVGEIFRSGHPDVYTVNDLTVAVTVDRRRTFGEM